MSKRKIWVRITDCRNIPLREGRSVRVAGREVAIFNLGERFLAVDNRCPHRDGPLAEGIIAGNAVVCPLHAWKIDLDSGTVVTTPKVSTCVETFRTRVEDGVVMLELSADCAAIEESIAAHADLPGRVSEFEARAEVPN